jgi:hypothetical protein
VKCSSESSEVRRVLSQVHDSTLFQLSPVSISIYCGEIQQSGAVPSMGGVEWSEPLLHSTPYRLEWSGVEWGLTPWTPWSGSKKGYPNSVSFGGI